MSNSFRFSALYLPGRIELKGDTRTIHIEAYRILKRFLYSATPYQIIEDRDDRVVLQVQEDQLKAFRKMSSEMLA
ncbi:MAG: hypothetical protein ACE5EH_08990 [Gammaproteobacteria bacterium]